MLSCYSSIDVPESGEQPFTDYSRWRLLVDGDGRHTWHYLQTEEQGKEWPQTNLDKYWLGLSMVHCISLQV